MLEPLTSSAAPIPLHAIAALAAVLLGAIQLVCPKGTTFHRVLGRLWVVLILTVAISGFFIHTFKVIGPFSWIHLLSIVTIATVVRAVYHARKGNIRAHRTAMLILFWVALIITGLFTLLPGRVMHAVVFGV